MCKIGVIATYTEFITSSRQIAAEVNQEIIIAQGALESGIDAAKLMLEEHRVDVIVSRGSTGKMLSKSFNVPVIVIEITNFDLIRAFHNAYNIDSKMAFIDYNQKEYSYDLESIKSIMSIEFSKYTFNDTNEIKELIRRIHETGTEVIVATAECIINEARKIGMKGILVNTTRREILNAYKRANLIYKYNRKEKENEKWMESILYNVQDGIIVIDSDNIVKIFNKSAENLLKINSKVIINKNVNTVLDNPVFSKLYGKGEVVSGDILELDNNRITVDRFKIIENGKYYGLEISIQKASKIIEMERQIRNKLHEKGFFAKSDIGDIITNDISMIDLKNKLQRYGSTKSTILVIGETGTGKELIAQSLHNQSSSKEGPFVAINCASLPASLLESELFGYEEGAFTGAKKGGKQGLFELAHKGTIFLDEIGEISPTLQARLLRVLQEKEVMKLGGDRIIPVDVRVICATNKNLLQKVKDGTFREDLYYRINILRIIVPPLRDRKRDLPLLFMSILNRINSDIQIGFDYEYLQYLVQYDWPGNVRELENFIERLVAISNNKKISEHNFKTTLNEVLAENENQTLIEDLSNINGKKMEISIGSLNDIQEQVIKFLDEVYSGDKNKISEILGISRTTLWRRKAQN